MENSTDDGGRKRQTLFNDPARRAEAEAARARGRKNRRVATLPTTLEGVERARAALYQHLIRGKITVAEAKVRLTILKDQERSLRDPLRAQVKEMTKQITQLRKAMGR